MSYFQPPDERPQWGTFYWRRHPPWKIHPTKEDALRTMEYQSYYGEVELWHFSEKQKKWVLMQTQGKENA